MSDWTVADTTTHQDHVIAHVLGTTVMGYLILDETLHILLDIGFIWTIYLDGQMVLLPQTAAVSELGLDSVTKMRLSREIEWLEQDGRAAEGIEVLTPAPVECLISDVSFFACGEQRKLLLVGEAANISIVTSLDTGHIDVGKGVGGDIVAR